MTNIQDEVRKIHNQYGMSEMANYKIQLLFEKYAKEYHDSKIKKSNIPAVIKSVCDCLFPDFIKVENKMVCGNCRLPKKQQTVL